PDAASVAVEGAEDDDDAGARDLAAVGVSAADAVVGISASGRTPDVLGALRAARGAGAPTGAVADSPRSPIAAAAGLTVGGETGDRRHDEEDRPKRPLDRRDDPPRQGLRAADGRPPRDKREAAPARATNRRRGRGGRRGRRAAGPRRGRRPREDRDRRPP